MNRAAPSSRIASPTPPSPRSSLPAGRASGDRPRTPHTFALASSLLSVLLATQVGCSSLSYPSTRAPADASDPPAAGAPAAPVLLGLGFGVPEEDQGMPAEAEAAPLGWAELTRNARLAGQEGDFDRAREDLRAAADQLSDLDAATAQRRTVAGMRARLALDFVALGQEDKANALADELFAEVTEAPELGGPAIVELAYFFANRREIASEEAGEPESQLPLFRIALLASEKTNASQSRLNLAFEISEAATRDGDHDLARRAIDLAVQDAQKIAPSDRDQMASLKIFKTRIALRQGDFLTAVASATAANRIFEEIDAPSANRAVAEATLARALAGTGELDRARAIADGAKARVEDGKRVPGYPKRIVYAEIGRGERAAGNLASAREYFDLALAIPPVDFEADALLRETLRRERAELD